jgi:hypothetical protein
MNSPSPPAVYDEGRLDSIHLLVAQFDCLLPVLQQLIVGLLLFTKLADRFYEAIGSSPVALRVRYAVSYGGAAMVFWCSAFDSSLSLAVLL